MRCTRFLLALSAEEQNRLRRLTFVISQAGRRKKWQEALQLLYTHEGADSIAALSWVRNKEATPTAQPRFLTQYATCEDLAMDSPGINASPRPASTGSGTSSPNQGPKPRSRAGSTASGSFHLVEVGNKNVRSNQGSPDLGVKPAPDHAGGP
eukprot:symbB.v1.2.029547.t1/scaffold3248.1/size60244/1